MGDFTELKTECFFGTIFRGFQAATLDPQTLPTLPSPTGIWFWMPGGEIQRGGGLEAKGLEAKTLSRKVSQPVGPLAGAGGYVCVCV